MLDSNALSYIMFVVLEILTIINCISICISIFRLNVYLKNNNCLNKNNINDDTNIKKLSINNNSFNIKY